MSQPQPSRNDAFIQPTLESLLHARLEFYRKLEKGREGAKAANSKLSKTKAAQSKRRKVLCLGGPLPTKSMAGLPNGRSDL